MTLLVSMGAFAQGNGIGGITEATNMVTSYFDPGTKLIYAIGAVIGLIGGVKVYSKFSSGDPETDADPLVDTCHIHDDEDYEQCEQSSCKDEQVLALESFELRAAPNPLVDIEFRHITGRMSVRWWR